MFHKCVIPLGVTNGNSSEASKLTLFLESPRISLISRLTLFNFRLWICCLTLAKPHNTFHIFLGPQATVDDKRKPVAYGRRLHCNRVNDPLNKCKKGTYNSKLRIYQNKSKYWKNVFTLQNKVLQLNLSVEKVVKKLRQKFDEIDIFYSRHLTPLYFDWDLVNKITVHLQIRCKTSRQNNFQQKRIKHVRYSRNTLNKWRKLLIQLNEWTNHKTNKRKSLTNGSIINSELNTINYEAGISYIIFC